MPDKDILEIDDHVTKLCNLYLPVDEASDDTLRQLVSFSKWFQNKETGSYYANLAKQEIVKRAQKKATAENFQRGDRVEVSEELKWWPRASSHPPPVGLKGVVLRSEIASSDRYVNSAGNTILEDYDGLVPTKFLSSDLGYGWEEGDDEDRKYITYNVPNYALRKIT